MINQLQTRITELIEEPAAVGKLLKQMRGRQEWYTQESQADLARKLGTSVMTISRLETQGFSKQGILALKILLHAIQTNQIKED